MDIFEFSELTAKPKYPSLSESFLEESIVVESSHKDKFYLDPPTRLLKRFIIDDSGLEQFSIGDDPTSDQPSKLIWGRGDVESDCCFSDNLSTDSALGPSAVSAEDFSCDEEDDDISFLGEQFKSMLSTRDKLSARCWAESRPKSLSEEIADADNNNQLQLTCQHRPEANSQLYCEVCEEMCCVDCKRDNHQGHKLTTAINAKMQRKLKLQTLKSGTRDKLNGATKQTVKLREYREQLLRQGQYIQDELTSKRDHLHELVDRWYDKRIFQLDIILQDEKIYIENMIQTLELHISTMDKACDESQQLIQDLTEGDRLRGRKDSIESIEDINQNKLPQLERKVNLILGVGTEITQDMFGNLSWGLSETNAEPVQAITPGKFLRQFDTRRGQSNRHTCYTASGLSLTSDNRLIVTDIGTDMVRVLDSEGNPKLQLNTFPLQRPTKAVCLHDRTFAVACKNSVKFFDAKGEYLRDLDSNLFCPYDVAVKRNGDLVVTDIGERQACIYIYSRDDHRVPNCIVGGIHAPAFRNAWNISIDRDDNIIVSDYEEHCVKIFTTNGLLICEFGQKGSGIGQFFHPAGTCVDHYGNILVADSANNRVQMFSSQGEFLAVVISDDLSGPVDIAINDDGQLLVLQGDGEVHVYSYMR